MSTPFGTLDVIDQLLAKNKERLGPFYRPLYLLSGAVVFLLLLALMVGAPLYFLQDFKYVTFVQVLLLVVYFMLLLTIAQNVFDRFVFCSVLFVTLAAAPVVIGGEMFLDLLTASDPGFFDEVGFPKTEFFLYGVLRGTGNATWTIPLLFYFFTFFPRFRNEAARKRALGIAFWVGLGLYALSSALLVWNNAIFERAFASTEFAEEFVRHHIERSQNGFLIFSLGYLLLGFAGLVAARFLARGRDLTVLLVTVATLGLQQVSFGVASHNVRQLNLRYPAARTAVQAVGAYEPSEGEGGRAVFSNTFLQTVSAEHLGGWQAFSVCRAPDSGRFNYEILPAEEFSRRYRPVDLVRLRLERPRELFCQPPED